LKEKAGFPWRVRPGSVAEKRFWQKYSMIVCQYACRLNANILTSFIRAISLKQMRKIRIWLTQKNFLIHKTVLAPWHDDCVSD
jgi:hypothetical protein